MSAAERLAFAAPCDGVEVHVIAQGTVTPENLPLVKTFLSFCYDKLTEHAHAD